MNKKHDRSPQRAPGHINKHRCCLQVVLAVRGRPRLWMYASQSARHQTSSKQSSQELKRSHGALRVYIQSRTRETWRNLRQHKINQLAWDPNSHTNQESKCRMGKPHGSKLNFSRGDIHQCRRLRKPTNHPLALTKGNRNVRSIRKCLNRNGKCN